MSRLIRNNIIKYTYYQQQISDDQMARDLIKERKIDMSTSKVMYMKEFTFSNIINETDDRFILNNSIQCTELAYEDE